MSAGLPVIATAAEGPAEFLRDQPAILVPLGSSDALASAITSAYARFHNDGLPRISYDLSLFDPAARLANITDFYGHVIDARLLSRAKVAEPVAIAT